MYYSNIEIFSGKYALGLGLGLSYNHSFRIPTLDEWVKFDMILVRDGVLGRGASTSGGIRLMHSITNRLLKS
jgi:hypothetical protein